MFGKLARLLFLGKKWLELKQEWGGVGQGQGRNNIAGPKLVRNLVGRSRERVGEIKPMD